MTANTVHSTCAYRRTSHSYFESKHGGFAKIIGIRYQLHNGILKIFNLRSESWSDLDGVTTLWIRLQLVKSPLVVVRKPCDRDDD